MDTSAIRNRGSRVRIVMWELTRACRLSCLHCAVNTEPLRSPMELSTYEAYKALDQMAALQPDEVIITGGDPLERPDIDQLVDYAARRGLEVTLEVSPTRSLTGAAVGNLRRHGVKRLAITIDDTVPAKHDAVYGVPGHFAATLMATRWARTSRLALEVNTLIGRAPAPDLERLSQLLTEIGAQRWNLYFLVPAGEAKGTTLLSASEVDDVFERLSEIAAIAPFAVRAFEAPHYRQFLIEKANGLRSQIAPSAVGRDELLFISHTGEVSISPFLPMTAGNIRYQPLSTINASADLLVALRDERNLKGKCGRCEYRTLCGGSRARAFAATSDVFATDPLCAYEPKSPLPASTSSRNMEVTP